LIDGTKLHIPLGSILLGENFNAGYSRVAVHRDKAEEQFALGIRFEASGSANDYVRLSRLLRKIEVLEKRPAVAEHIEYLRPRRPAGRRPRWFRLAATYGEIEIYRVPSGGYRNS
jgi:hypothetical protein